MTFEPISDQLLHTLEHNFQHSPRLSSGLSGLPSLSSPSSPSSFSSLPPSYPLNEPPSSGHNHFPNPPLPSPIPALPSVSSPSGLFLSDIPSKPLTWLWPGRIPLGHLTLLDAAPGCDPSLFALTLAASISSGSPLPDGTPTQPANVILFAPYDSASDTLKPRLEAAGGDPAHVLLFRPSHPSRPSTEQTSSANSPTHTFTLPHDLPQLATTIRSLEARLVILDPAGAIPGLSRSLPALLDLAQQTNCAILLTRSLRTPIADPLHALGPSSPLLDAARSRLLLTPDPRNESHCLLLTTHHLLCTQPPILAYDLRFSPSGLPTLHCLGEQDRSLLARLCTGPLQSPHRQAILRFLHNSTSPRTVPDILAATSYDQDAGRQMLVRMRMSGELVSPSRGLYTTPNHHCLTNSPNDTPPVTNVTTDSHLPTSATTIGSPNPNPPVINVTNVTTDPNPSISPVTNVTIGSTDLNFLIPPVTNITTIPTHYCDASHPLV